MGHWSLVVVTQPPIHCGSCSDLHDSITGSGTKKVKNKIINKLFDYCVHSRISVLIATVKFG